MIDLGTIYLYIYLVTHFSGTKVDMTKFSQILPFYTETINAVFKKEKKEKRNATIIKFLPIPPVTPTNLEEQQNRKTRGSIKI